MPTWHPPIGARWGVCVCNAAAIISVFGMARPVPNAREKWKILAKRSSGHETEIIKNDQVIPEYPKITTEEEFNKLFGMATIMGKDGKPTAIDFTKQFVLGVYHHP